MQFAARRVGRLEVGILLVILTGLTLILVGSWKIRTAMTYGGDGPILYAHLFNDPERFRGDLLETYGAEQVCATAQNLIGAVSLSYLGMDPTYAAWLMVYAQNVLLGVAMFRLAMVITGRRDVAWLSVFFTFAATVWQWNLASYGTVMWSPYAGHLATPFLIFAMSYALERRNVLASAHLIVAGAFHPSLTIGAVALLGLYWLSDGIISRIGMRRVTGQMLLLALVVALTVVPRMVLLNQEEQLTNPEMWDAIRLNAHFTPWDAAWRWHRDLVTVLGFGVLAFLGMRRLPEHRRSSLVFWTTMLVGSVLAIVVHVAGWQLRSVDIVRLSPMRTVMIAVMTCLPLVADYVLAKVRSEGLLRRWAVLVIFGFLAAYQFGALWLFLAALVLLEVAEGSFGPFAFEVSKSLFRATKVMAWTAAGLGIAIVLTAPTIRLLGRLQLDGIEPLGRKKWLLIFGIAALVAIAAEKWIGSAISRFAQRGEPTLVARGSRMRQFLAAQGPAAIASWAVVLIIAVLAVDRCLEFGRQTREPRTLDLYAAQVWARNHTPTDAQFIIFDQPWRTETLRRVVIPRAMMWYIYVRRPSCKAYDDGYLDFFGFEDGLAGFTMLTYYGAQHDAYLALDAEGMRRFRRRFGGDYVVRWRDEPALDLPVAFNSDHVLVYALTADAVDTSVANKPPAQSSSVHPAAERR